MTNQKQDIPIAKIFTFKGKCFLYDTYTNRLLEITKEHFGEIKKLQSIGLDSYKQLNKHEKTYKDVIMLIQKGFLKSSFVDRIEHPETKYIPYIIDRCIHDITLQVTKDCNFNCRYCMFANDNNIDRNHEKQYMSWDIAKRSVDFLYDHSKDCKNVTISFYGGEPLLNFKLIKDVVDYAEKCFFSKKIKYVMTINGSILSDEMIDYFAKHKFLLTISFDGPKEIQNFHRKFKEAGEETYDLVLRNILRLQNKHKDYFNNYVNFIPVTFEDENYQEVIDFFKTIDISSDKLHRSMAELRGIDYVNNNIYNFDNNFSDTDSSSNIDEKSETVYSNKSVPPLTWHHNGPCIPTLKRLMVTTDGSLYICEKIIEKKELSIGNIFDGVDISKVYDFLNIGKLTEDECKECWAMRFCSMCAMYCIDPETNSFSKKCKQISCKKIRSDTLSYFKHKLE